MIFSVVLVVFAALAYAFGSPHNPYDYPVHDCMGQEILVTESVKVEEHVINITVPACPNYVPRSNAIDITESLLGRHVIQTRNAANLERKDTEAPAASPSECTNPSICQCGQPCTVTCGPGTSPPDPDPSIGDCRNLASVLRLFQQSIGATFIQTRSFPNPTFIDFSSCRAAFGNINAAGVLIEYCWDGLADNVASLINGCITPGIAQGGDCTATSGLWEMSLSGLNRMA